MQEISRNSTPTLHLFVPNPVGGICDLDVTFKQGNKIVLEKTIEDVELNRHRKTVNFRLTREETNKLIPSKNVHLQLTAKYSNGTQIPYGETTLYVKGVLNDTVID